MNKMFTDREPARASLFTGGTLRATYDLWSGRPCSPTVNPRGREGPVPQNVQKKVHFYTVFGRYAIFALRLPKYEKIEAM